MFATNALVPYLPDALTHFNATQEMAIDSYRSRRDRIPILLVTSASEAECIRECAK
jgi:hypothetical protein